MANRFERIDNTAPVTDVAENLDANVKYSTFDLGYKKIGQALPFAIIPIDCIDTVPNTKVNLNYDVQITFRNPTVRKMLNGWRCYIHSYYNRNYDLWEGWNNFITRGRSGQEKNLEIPHIKTRFKNKAGNVVTPFTPMGLYDYLGYAPEAVRATTSGGTTTHQLTKDYLGYPAILTGTDGTTADTQNHIDTNLADYTNIKIEALKAMMYQRLWRDKYSPKNLLQTNTKVFPGNEDHFILSYNASEVSVVDYENENKTQLAGTENSYEDTIGILNDGSATDLRLDLLRYRQFMGDRFTTSSPFNEMIRGDTPEINLTIDGSDLVGKLKLNDDNNAIIGKKGSPVAQYHMYNGEDSSENTSPRNYDKGVLWVNTSNSYSGIEKMYVSTGKKSTESGGVFIRDTIDVPITGTTITSSISLSDLRSLEVFTIFAERMGRTNGDYNDMIKAQFNHNPKSDTREAIYIGGSYQDIISNSIYQTSESGNSPLGTQVAQGISASYNKIGEFTADDYGIVMTVMMIVPETIYVNGIDRKETALTMEEQYFPIMNNLSAEGVLNRELYVSGTESTDNDVWGWAERFSEYKSRQNKVCGLSQLPASISAYDSALVMARRFSTTPQLNANFVTGIPQNYSLDTFASTEEPPFDFAIRCDSVVTYPMPYVTIPGGLSTRA